MKVDISYKCQLFTALLIPVEVAESAYAILSCTCRKILVLKSVFYLLTLFECFTFSDIISKMALSAICYQPNLDCLGTGNPWVVGSTLIFAPPQQCSWSQNPRAARCSLLIRPQYKIVSRAQCSRSGHSPLKGQIFDTLAIHFRSLHRCNALPASKF